MILYTIQIGLEAAILLKKRNSLCDKIKGAENIEGLKNFYRNCNFDKNILSKGSGTFCSLEEYK